MLFKASKCSVTNVGRQEEDHRDEFCGMTFKFTTEERALGALI